MTAGAPAVNMPAPAPGSVWAIAAASFAAYAVLYRLSAEVSLRRVPAYGRLAAASRVYWNTLAPSTAHALVVTALCLQQLASGAFSAASCAAAGTLPVLRATRGSWAAVGVSLGYFAADSFMVVAEAAVWSTAIAAHHAMALASLASAVASGGGHAYLLFGLFTEVTTPFVNLRWRLHEAGAKASRAYAANGLALAAVWGACRVLAFGPLFAHVAANLADARAHLPWYALAVLLVVPAALFAMNVLWYAKILKGAAKLVRGRRAAHHACGAGAGGAAPAEARGSGGGGKDGGCAGAGADATVVVQAFTGDAARKDD